MKRNREWWLTMVLVVSVTVIGGVLLAGCEYFRPTPPPEPPPAGPAEEEEEEKSEYPDIGGDWDATLKTGGVTMMKIEMTLVQDEDEVEGSWHQSPGPFGGGVEGEIEKDGDVELKLKWNPGTEVTAFVLEGEAEDDGDEMDGEFEEKIGTMRTGKWKAEKD